MKRLCRECEEPLEVDQDICRTCGANNPIPLPWYTFILGAAIVVVIVLLATSSNKIARRCSRCGEINREAAIFCAQGGNRLSMRG